MTERYKKLLSEIYPSGKLYDELLPEGDPLDKTGLFRYGVLFCLGYIGCGSFFDVYRAVDIHGRAYAVKVMRINEQSTRFPLSPLDVTKRVFGEIELLEKLRDDPGVIRLTRYYPSKAAICEHIRRSENTGRGRSEKQPQIVQVMPLCLPYDKFLEWLLHDGRRLTEEEIAALLIDLVSCVKQLHNKDVIHRDIKPSNIMLTRRDDGSIGAVLTDFNVSKTFVGYMDDDFTPVGTPTYVHPMLIGDYDSVDRDSAKRNDIYSIGVIAYQLANGGKKPSPCRHLPEPKYLPSQRIGKLIKDMMNLDISKIPGSEEVLARLYRITENASDAVFVSPEERYKPPKKSAKVYTPSHKSDDRYISRDFPERFTFPEPDCPYVQPFVRRCEPPEQAYADFDSVFDDAFGDGFNDMFSAFDKFDKMRF